MHQENEVKFRIEDPEAPRSILKKLGAENKGKVLEHNVCFEGKGISKENGNLLRVRKTNKVIVTIKGKIDPKARFKNRKESEFEVPDFDNIIKLLHDIGLRDYWRYEKERETWILDGVEVVIDKLPELGYYIEIEGTDKEIQSVVKKLGLNTKDGITKSYIDIWQEHKKQLVDMIF